MSKRNPRKKIPPEKMCQYVYPDDPDDPKYDEERAGKQCQAISMKGSKFCYYHQPNQEKVMEQLAEARDARQNPPNLQHGYYSKEKRECDTCTLAIGCQYFEAGKKVCDFDLNPDIDLSSLKEIQKFAEEIMSSEIMTYKLLETIVKINPENADLIDLKRKYSKTIMSTLKDFSSIKDSYEKRKSGSSWENILNPS